MWGVDTFLGNAVTVEEPFTLNQGMLHALLPHGTSTASEYRTYNASNVLSFAYGFLNSGVAAAAAHVLVGESGAAPNPITELNIGSDATATSFTDINFDIQGVTEYNMTAAAFTLSDANNIVVGTGTGTQYGTAAAQKLGKWGATPIVQPSSTGQTAGSTVGVGNNVNDDSTFTGGVGATAYTIGDIVKHLKNAGNIAQ